MSGHKLHMLLIPSDTNEYKINLVGRQKLFSWLWVGLYPIDTV